jgi:hypothetical protein
MNILKKADEIVHERSEEKEREYGPFHESMERTARIASEMCGKEITPVMAYNVIIALKLARLSYRYKEDSALDICAYIGSLNDYMMRDTNKDGYVDEKDRITTEIEIDNGGDILRIINDKKVNTQFDNSTQNY